MLGCWGLGFRVAGFGGLEEDFEGFGVVCVSA